MRTIALGLLMSGGLLAGCAQKPAPAPMPRVPTSQQVSEMRDAFKKVSPSARVGIVTAVLADQSLAMVGDFPVDGVRAGDIISFVDADEQAIAHGDVIEIRDGKVIVHFQAAARAPMVGDAAVKF
jgi:hypothetical protein